MSKPKGKRVVVTIGDPAGCGPQVTFQAIYSLAKKGVEIWVVGDRFVAEQFRQYHQLKKQIIFVDVATKNIRKVKKGTISKLSGLASLSYLNHALGIIKAEKIQLLVTAPVSKEAISLVQPGFLGHTEFLADYFDVKSVVMMMVSAQLRVVLLTRHLNLKRVPDAINQKLIKDTVFLVTSFLKRKLGIKKPNIGIASFNPHAGINTFLGPEEKKIKEFLSSLDQPVLGPYPADSLFIQGNLGKFDCIIALYHDQGMIPFKLLALRWGVNITLGLPIIRTSPDHGVAFDLVKRDPKAIFSTSMQAALAWGIDLLDKV